MLNLRNNEDMLYSHPIFDVDDPNLKNNSFQNQIDFKTINEGNNEDLKSSTQPLNNMFAKPNDENFGKNRVTSPNSHPANLTDGINLLNNEFSIINNGQLKNSRFKWVSSDEIALNENHPSHSDPPNIFEPIEGSNKGITDGNF